MKTAKNISITMPPGMLKKAEIASKEDGRNMSELMREALRHYLERREWQQEWNIIRGYGIKKTKEMGIKPRDVNRLIKEYRAEQRAADRR